MAHGRRNYVMLPEHEAHIWKPLRLCPFDKVKVLMVFTEPPTDERTSHGIPLSKPFNERKTNGTHRLFNHLQKQCGIKPARHGDLTGWLMNGVLMLYMYPTSRFKEPLYHENKFKWDLLMFEILSVLNARKDPCVFVFFDNVGYKLTTMLGDVNPQHKLIHTRHPLSLDRSHGTAALFTDVSVFKEACDFLNIPATKLWSLP